jgi:tetratricopeptide (TPR) repeat protein
LEIKPDDPNTYYNKACCYGLQNNVELAIENLHRAISLDEQYCEIVKTDQDFDQIREDEQFQGAFVDVDR